MNVVAISIGVVEVTFDAPVDGTILDPDFLHDDTTGDSTTIFGVQVDPVTVDFNFTVPGTFSPGDTWSLTRAQPTLIFPQTGTCS